MWLHRKFAEIVYGVVRRNNTVSRTNHGRIYMPDRVERSFGVFDNVSVSEMMIGRKRDSHFCPSQPRDFLAATVSGVMARGSSPQA